jgi:sucrose-6-phosphate hydrolase SacC (GH32 family)
MHFTPEANWMNDPNGLVRLDDTYHLFYQHNPYGRTHGNMHWGHAASPDLHDWTDHPIALAPDKLGQICSGSIVVDSDNTAGFGSGALVAAFTHATTDRQSQSLAFSMDRGRTWAKYAHNPVIDSIADVPDFRDPMVFRYSSPGGDSWWVMLLAVGTEVWLYRSADLLTWTRSSVYAPEMPFPNAVLEVPGLLSIPIDDGDRAAWMLIVSAATSGGAAWPGSDGVYWIPGTFDGWRFVAETGASLERLDHGPSFYAAMAWARGPNSRPVLIGWMDESHGFGTRSELPWTGRMSLPRELAVTSSRDGLALVQRPIVPDELMRGRRSTLIAGPGESVDLQDVASVARFSITGPASSGGSLTFDLSQRSESDPLIRTTAEDDLATISVHTSGDVYEVRIPTRPLVAVHMDVVVDRGSVEFFVDSGRHVASYIVWIGPGSLRASVRNDRTTAVSVELLTLPNATDRHSTDAAIGPPTGH